MQLAQKMRRRGNLVSAGERLAYVVVESESKKDKLFEKIEDLDYFRENIKYITIDHLYYIKLMINPIDEVIKAVYGKSDVFKNIYKHRENYEKVISQLNEAFSPRITLLE
jgi:DNA polymerase elongation subunit (family B)